LKIEKDFPSKSLAYYTLIISTACVVLFSPFDYPVYPNKVLVYLTYWLDPLIFQFLSLGLLLILVHYWSVRRYPYGKIWMIGTPFIVLLFLLEIRFDNLFASLLFGKERYWQPLDEPFFTSWIKNLFPSLLSTGDSTPSGFALRQWMLTLGIFFMLDRSNLPLDKRYSNAIKGYSSLALVYVSLARVLRLAHVPVDIAVSIALGAIAFWGMIFLGCSILRISLAEDISVFYGLTSFLISIILTMISNYPSLWILIIFTFIIVAWLALIVNKSTRVGFK